LHSPKRNIFNCLTDIKLLTKLKLIFLKARYSLIVLKVPLNPNQSINPHSRLYCRYGIFFVFFRCSGLLCIFSAALFLLFFDSELSRIVFVAEV